MVIIENNVLDIWLQQASTWYPASNVPPAQSVIDGGPPQNGGAPVTGGTCAQILSS